MFSRIPRIKNIKKNKEIWVVKQRVVEEKQVEKIKMLSDKITEPLLDLDKFSFNEHITLLQKFANDPCFNVHQTGFGSYIVNHHVIKEKDRNI
jgi:hypothetical protein